MTESKKSVSGESLRRLDILAKFGELALRSDDLDEILHEACRIVSEALGVDLAKVMELQDDGVTLLVRAGVGWPPGVIGKVTVKAVIGSSEGYALKTGNPAISKNIETETRFSYSDFIIDAGVKALVNVIIISPERRQPYGILQVDSRTPRNFSTRDTKFLRTYANFLAAAVDRIRVAHTLRGSNVTLEARIAQRTRELEMEQKERASAEEKLWQAQKMEAVGQLTGGLAHDFNNMLQGITGSLAFIRKRLDQGRPAEVERYVLAAEEAARRAAAVTHRLLAFSRQQTLDPKPTDLGTLVHGMEDWIRRTMGPAVEVEVDAAGAMGTSLVDRNQLENALLNLCINARDAMPQGGHLTIRLGRETTDEITAVGREVAEGDYLSLRVTDTGTGMTPSVMRRAFDPFFTTKPLGAGTGLGLSMIYGFARQSGGHVAIASEERRGTTVSLYLPRHGGLECAEDAVVPVATIEHAEMGETVLVVDDEPTVRMLVREVLEDLGYAALTAADGEAGMMVLRSAVRIDLLITDIGLPGGMNGKQVAEAARVARPGLKVLFITGYAEKAVLGDSPLDEGMQVLAKPFAMETLARRISDLIAA